MSPVDRIMATRESSKSIDAFSRMDFAATRRALLDTKRRITQKAKNTFQSEGVILGSDDEQFKDERKVELSALKDKLTRLATSIDHFSSRLNMLAESSLEMSNGCLEFQGEQKDTTRNKGYINAVSLSEALGASELNAKNAVTALAEAHESLRRKIADFRSVETMVRCALV